MSPRLVSGSVAVAITVFAIVSDWFFIVFVGFLTIGGLYEFFYLMNKKKDIPIYSYTGILIGLMIPLSIYFKFEPTKNWELLFIVCAFLLILLLQFAREDNRNAVLGLSTTLFGVLYVSWFFSFIVKIRFLLPGVEGVKLVAFIVAVTKSGDMGALFLGRRFGRYPLLPKVSPNKSVEGTIGGLLVSSVVAVLLTSFLPPLAHYTVLYVALLGAFFGSLGQLGDLSESLIKRDCEVKDSGNLMPGIGGVLDGIDSLLFSVPAFYLYMSSTLNFF